MSLSDFMPYGAPELIEGAAPRMARSTLAATGLVAGLVWLGGLLASGERTLPVPCIPVPPGIKLQPEPRIIRPRVADFTPVPPAPPRYAEPRVVAEVPVEEPKPVEPMTTDAPPISPTGEPDGLARTTPGNEAAKGEPAIGEWVYTDVLPQPVRCAEAVYPDIAREAGVEGLVRVQMLIGLDGHVVRAVLQPGSRRSMLDEAALAAARTCVFTPALANGHPVMVWMGQAYRFRLH